MNKQEYINFTESTFGTKCLEAKYEYFKKSMIFDKGLTIKDFMFILEKYYIINEAQTWADFHHFMNLITIEEAGGGKT